MRFITRRDDGNFWYVQIRVMVNGKRHQLSGKSFYDRNYRNSLHALEEAVAFRDKNAQAFFQKVGYEISEKPKLPPRPPKFRKRKEAITGPLSNLHYIHLYKKDGKYNRAVLDITVNIHGKAYHSTTYSYDFNKYGGREQSLKIVKHDRNRLATLVQQKAMELGEDHSRSPEEIKEIVKAIKISKTPPTNPADLERFIKRSKSQDFWIVSIRKKIWGTYYRVPNKRFYDRQFGGKHKSKLEARRYAGRVDTAVDREFDRLRDLKIDDRKDINKRLLAVVKEID
ncbi:MAG TPA: hypothetical protein PKV71_16230 [Calditrichia bacterium]|nr:hypothetical protein [Calditrichia bacterium]